MTIFKTMAITGLLAAASFSVGTTAQAKGGDQAYRGPVAYPQINVPFSSRSIGIPGPERTCVKWCDRDSSPCDPIEFKQADGRCVYE